MPTPYLLNGHLQTFYYSLINSTFKPGDAYDYERAVVKLEDGGQIALDWICFPRPKETLSRKVPLVVIFPGLTGDRKCAYMKALFEEAHAKGYKCIVVNHRGCGDTPMTTRNPTANSQLDCRAGGLRAT